MLGYSVQIFRLKTTPKVYKLWQFKGLFKRGHICVNITACVYFLLSVFVTSKPAEVFGVCIKQTQLYQVFCVKELHCTFCVTGARVTCGRILCYQCCVTCGSILGYQCCVTCGSILFYQCYMTCGSILCYQCYMTCGSFLCYQCCVTCGRILCYDESRIDICPLLTEEILSHEAK